MGFWYRFFHVPVSAGRTGKAEPLSGFSAASRLSVCLQMWSSELDMSLQHRDSTRLHSWSYTQCSQFSSLLLVSGLCGAPQPLLKGHSVISMKWGSLGLMSAG